MSLDPYAVRNAAERDAEDEYISDLAANAGDLDANQLQRELVAAVGPNRNVLNQLAVNVQNAKPGIASPSLRAWANSFVANESRSEPPLQPLAIPISQLTVNNGPRIATTRNTVPPARSTIPPPVPSRDSQPRRMALQSAPPPLPPRRNQPRISNDEFNRPLYREYYQQDVARRSTKFRLTKFQSVIGLVGGAALVAASISLIAEQNRSPTKQKKGVNIFAIVAAVIGSVGAFYSVSQLMQRNAPTVQEVYAAS